VSVLSRDQQLRVLAALVDGNSERAVERITGVCRPAIARLGLLLGQGAQRVHDRLMRALRCSLLEIDEIWSYIGKKQARLTAADSPDFGDCYTFVALDASSRMVLSFRAGKRDQETTDAFIDDLRARLLVMPQITSDGFPCYPSAIVEAFGRSVDYAQLHKTFRQGGARDDDYRTEQPRNPVVTKRAMLGAPDMAKVSTSYVERQNGTMRAHIGRIRRFVYAFSKSLEHHRAAVSLGYVWYNLGHVVRTLRVTPAMQAGVTTHVWSLEEFLDAVLAEPAGDKPVKVSLAHRTPTETARELPNGRGFLRALPGGKGAPSAPTPAPTPPAVEPAAEDPPRQLSLLEWKPRPKKKPVLGQLSLFDLLGGGDDGED